MPGTRHQDGDRFDRLRGLLREVVAERPFYRRLYESAGISLDDAFLDRLEERFDELPIVETDDVLEQVDAMRIDPGRIFRVTCSGGTLDHPKVLYRTAEDWETSSRNVAELFAVAGVGAGNVLLIAQPLRIWGVGYLALDSCRELGCMAVPVGIHEEPERLESFIRRFGVDTVYASPSLWKRFTRWAEDHGLRRQIRVLCAGEKLYEEDRRRLEEYWGAGVFSIYGSEETDGLGAECTEHQGFHILESSFLYQVERGGTRLPTDRIGSFEGDLIVTSLYHQGTPLVRYRLGDIVRLERFEGRCACGRPGPRMRVLGKSKQCVTLFDATKVFIYQTDAALGEILGREVQYQLLVEDGDPGDGVIERLTFLLSPRDLEGVDVSSAARRLAALSLDLGDSVTRGQLELRVAAGSGGAQTTRKGKWQKIIDRRQAPRV